MIESNTIEIGQRIAKSIRERNGGLLGVQAMAFPHGENQGFLPNSHVDFQFLV